jgi:hypothetical protein
MMNEAYIEKIKKSLVNNYDIRYRDIKCGEVNIHIIYCKTMSDHNFISMHIVSPLIESKNNCLDVQYIKDKVITSCSIGNVPCLEEALLHIISGNTVIVMDNSNQMLFCESKRFSGRAVEIPPTESVIKGSREGFNENLDDSMANIRRRIKDTNLKIEYVGVNNNSNTAIMIYIQNKAPEKLVNHIRNRMLKVQNNTNRNINIFEEALRHKGTPFDTIGYTEKPDTAAEKINEGRVVVMINGAPFVLIAPYFFVENFHTTDDYNLNKYVAFIGRVLRWFSFGAATLLPGTYIALFTYHFKLIPYVFVFNLARSRISVPFPLAVEAIVMIVFFQILREAGVRLPQPIGPALSIVGALILGDAAVRSGMASQATVLITALTSIATFLIPGLYVPIFISNMMIIIFSSFLGLPGFFTAAILLCAHLSGLTSCGYPYLYPLGTLKNFKYEDLLKRGSLETINQSIFTKDDSQ